MHIFWYKDSITGHLKQVDALLMQLQKEVQFSLSSINCEKNRVTNALQSVLEKHNDENFPIVLMGAGHTVYPKILSSQKFIKETLGLDSISIAIMRPSRNISAFDLIFAPEHDFIKQKTPNNVITYQGALASTSFAASDNKKAIIAIGGKSKHYKFDEKIVLMQLKYILNIHPNHEFNIFNSRRTPQSLNTQIEDELKNFTNARFINIDHPNDLSFNASLCESSLKFVTPDSANLVFESLSTHGKTYLIQIESPNYRRWFGSKKIRSTMNNLVMSKQVGVVSLLAKKNKLKISKIENPHPGIQPLAEVEKISFAILKYLRGQ